MACGTSKLSKIPCTCRFPFKKYKKSTHHMQQPLPSERRIFNDLCRWGTSVNLLVQVDLQKPPSFGSGCVNYKVSRQHYQNRWVNAVYCFFRGQAPAGNFHSGSSCTKGLNGSKSLQCQGFFSAPLSLFGVDSPCALSVSLPTLPIPGWPDSRALLLP